MRTAIRLYVSIAACLFTPCCGDSLMSGGRDGKVHNDSPNEHITTVNSGSMWTEGRAREREEKKDTRQTETVTKTETDTEAEGQSKTDTEAVRQSKTDTETERDGEDRDTET